MSNFPDPKTLVSSTGLAPSSHLQKVLQSELDRLPELPQKAVATGQALNANKAGAFEIALRESH